MTLVVRLAFQVMFVLLVLMGIHLLQALQIEMDTHAYHAREDARIVMNRQENALHASLDIVLMDGNALKTFSLNFQSHSLPI